MEIEKIFLYRITHIKNISHVLSHGITQKSSTHANPAFQAIGDKSLIDNRSGKQVIIDNGDLFNVKAASITLGDFIPFYFGVRMPMLYVIQVGGNFAKEQKPQDIVYIACSLKSIIANNLRFYFTDGHATDHFTTFYDSEKVNEISEIIDWKAIKSKYWGGQENLDAKRKKQAEFLVQDDVPVQCIRGYGVYNETAKEKMIKFGIDGSIIKIIPNAYY